MLLDDMLLSENWGDPAKDDEGYALQDRFSSKSGFCFQKSTLKYQL